MSKSLYNSFYKQSPDGGWLQYFLIYHGIFRDIPYQIFMLWSVELISLFKTKSSFLFNTLEFFLTTVFFFLKIVIMYLVYILLLQCWKIFHNMGSNLFWHTDLNIKTISRYFLSIYVMPGPMVQMSNIRVFSL